MNDRPAIDRVRFRTMSTGELRASLLVDREVLDYLDQEALTFLSEELTRRLVE